MRKYINVIHDIIKLNEKNNFTVSVSGKTEFDKIQPLFCTEILSELEMKVIKITLTKCQNMS